MEKAKIADKAPQKVELTAGKRYAWCSCGISDKQPFCDGSHRENDFSPHLFKSEKAEEAWICMCKQTKNPPYCDGSHNKLKENSSSTPNAEKEANSSKATEKQMTYTNGEITIVWKPSVCIHSAVCVKQLPSVYNPKARPWISIENASTEELIQQLDKCPSAALSYYWNKDKR